MDPKSGSLRSPSSGAWTDVSASPTPPSAAMYHNTLYRGPEGLLQMPPMFEIALIFRENAESMKGIQLFPGFILKLLQFKGLNRAQRLKDHCEFLWLAVIYKASAPTQQSGAARLPFQPESSVSVRNPDDTFLTAPQSLGLQVNFPDTGRGSSFDGLPPLRQFYRLHKH